MTDFEHAPHTPGEFIGDAVYGANDGIITTFAVISGATGAVLSSDVIVILGVASLIADGFSMGASSYLSIQSERAYKAQNGEVVRGHYPHEHGLATFGAFLLAGALPLAPFFLAVPPAYQFEVSATATACALFVVGGARSFVTGRQFWKAGIEMLVVGGIAASIAYGIGWGIDAFVI